MVPSGFVYGFLNKIPQTVGKTFDNRFRDPVFMF